MYAIDALKCVYDTKNRKWAVEILYAEGEKTYRFDIAGPEEARTVVEAFDMAMVSIFDPQSGEIHFIHEPRGGEMDEDGGEGENDGDDHDADPGARRQ